MKGKGKSHDSDDEMEIQQVAPDFDDEDDSQIQQNSTLSSLARKNQGNSNKSQQQQQQIVPKKLTAEEIEAQALEKMPMMPDSEISPAAYVFQHQEDHDDLNLYEEKSTKVKCPYCDAVSQSIVEYRPTLIGYLLTMIAMMIFGILSLMLLPFLVSLTKQAIHRCGRCLNEVKSNSMFGFSNMEDKVLTFSIGKFGVILSRRMLMYLISVITVILSIYTFIIVEESYNHEIVPISGYTWQEYIADCGLQKMVRDPRRTQQKFENKYWGKGVQWRGNIVKISVNDQDLMAIAYHSTQITIKMDQDDKVADNDVAGAEVGLSFGEHTTRELAPILDQLHRGDRIEFEGSMIQPGDQKHLHHLHGWNVTVIEGEHKSMDQYTTGSGRYKVKAIEHNHQD